MVDAGASSYLRTKEGETAAGTTAASQEAFRCLTGKEALDFYSRFCAEAFYAPPQHPNWVSSWARHCNEDIVVLASTGSGKMALVLEIVQESALRIARFPGGRHANANFPATNHRQPIMLERNDRTALADSLRRIRSDVDLVLLERLTGHASGVENPLARLCSWHSPNIALSADLSNGFDVLVDRRNGRRKRKKHRYQTRKFEAAGGFRRIQASNRADAELLLERFFEMKAARFAQSGIRDVFADERVKDFFRDLFGAASEQGPDPDFVLHGLEVGGKFRAVTGCSRTRAGLTCEFGSIAEDELAALSPGEFLFYENIKEACEDGLHVYDFGVGDENYKRDWCDVETTHFDVAIPLTTRGTISVCLRQATNAAKRHIKSNRLAWTLVKRLRRRSASVSKADAD